MTDDNRAWRPVFDVDTPWPAVEALIERYTQIAVADLRVQLDADVDLTPAERRSMVELATPLIRQQTRNAFTAGWDRLQAERSAPILH